MRDDLPEALTATPEPEHCGVVHYIHQPHDWLKLHDNLREVSPRRCAGTLPGTPVGD